MGGQVGKAEAQAGKKAGRARSSKIHRGTHPPTAKLTQAGACLGKCTVKQRTSMYAAKAQAGAS